MKHLSDWEKRESKRKRGKKEEEWEKERQYENVVKIVSVLVPFRIAISRETMLSKWNDDGQDKPGPNFPR